MAFATEVFSASPQFWEIRSGNRGIVTLPAEGRSMLVPSYWRLILGECVRPRTIEDHCEHIRASMQLPERIAVERLFAEFRRLGLLVPLSTREICFKRNGEAVDVIAVVTADRPKRCYDLVDGLVRSGAASKSKIVIVDGSPGVAECRLLRQALRSLIQISPTDVIYFGREERIALCKLLTRRGLPPKVCNWLLNEVHGVFSAGAARNVVLLLTCGRRLLMLDDDVDPRPLRPKTSCKDLILGGDKWERDIRFYGSRDKALAAVRQLPADDLTSSVGEILGLSLSEIVSKWEGRVQLTDICEHQREHLLAGGGVIAATQVGIVGDSAMHTSDWVGMLGEKVRNRLDHSLEESQNASNSREVVNISSSCAVYHPTDLMSYALGLDNSLHLPFFMPRFRNEDGIFGCLLRILSPSAYSAHLPLGVLHEAELGRSYEHGTKLRICDFIFSLVGDVQNGCHISASEATRNLGGYLRSLVHSDPRDLSLCLQRWAMEGYLMRLHFIDSCRKGSSAKHRKDQLDELEKQLIRAIRTPESIIPLEFQNHNDTLESCIGRISHLMEEFAEALIYWPDIRREAADSDLSVRC